MAPIVATIKALGKPPPAETPKKRNKKPPIRTLNTPTMILPTTPNPPPAINCPACHPGGKINQDKPDKFHITISLLSA
jgi:hypothetical protein